MLLLKWPILLNGNLLQSATDSLEIEDAITTGLKSVFKNVSFCTTLFRVICENKIKTK
jgi:hypothetical protein